MVLLLENIARKLKYRFGDAHKVPAVSGMGRGGIKNRNLFTDDATKGNNRTGKFGQEHEPRWVAYTLHIFSFLTRIMH